MYRLENDLVRTARPGPEQRPISDDRLDDRRHWYYIYGWVLDAEHGDTLFGVLLKGSNISSSTWCPNQITWAAEWVSDTP